MTRRAVRGSLLLVALSAGACSADDAAPTEPFPLEFDGALTSLWTKEAASRIETAWQHTIPLVQRAERPILPGYYVWDSWPLRNKDGSIARLNGWYVIISLTARDTMLPGARHGASELRYLVSRDGASWKLGGTLFPPGQGLGRAQWAGSTVYDPAAGVATAFYTALGVAEGRDRASGEERRAAQQRLVTTSSPVAATDSGVAFTNWGPHRVILEPDGRYYEREANATGIWAFRDPWFFVDPRSGRSYLTFMANLAAVGSPRSPGGSTSASAEIEHNGAVGLAVAEDNGLTSWRLLPPLVGAPGVNSQLERPHFVFQNNRYYLFVSSHAFTFAPPLTGPDGLYGFVADSLSGRYVPLNGSGLVAGNPRTAPLQTYSYLVLPGGKVLSYVGYVNLGGVSLGEIGQQSAQFQKEHFGGTLAPLFTVAIQGDSTRIVAADAGATFALR